MYASAARRDVVEDVKNVQVAIEAKNYVLLADGYVDDVVSGRITAGGWVQKACRRFQRMREHATGLDASYIFTVEQANAALPWVRFLR